MSDIAFIFPGQGSQSVGMIAEQYENHPVVRDCLNQASDVLAFDMVKLVLEGPTEVLNQTHNTQPALLATSVALYRLWQHENGPEPSLMAGHSLGEYSALVCAGALAYEDALKLVRLRGEFMIDAAPAGSGAMAAILGLENQQVEEACAKAAGDQVVSAVNYNSPGQLVIAGNKEAVDRAIELCKEAGAKRALPLPVSVPSHCALMHPAAERLAETLENIKIEPTSIPVINNVDVKVAKSADKIADALIRQLYSPVRWTETIQSMQAQGINNLVECGPGKVLAGLAKRIDRSMNAFVTCDQSNFNKSLEALK